MGHPSLRTVPRGLLPLAIRVATRGRWRSRFIAANRQDHGGGKSFWVARAFGASGASRLLGYGRRNTTSELEDVRRRLNVPAVNGMIDSGFKGSKIHRFCLATGWRAMKSDDAEWFLKPGPA